MQKQFKSQIIGGDEVTLEVDFGDGFEGESCDGESVEIESATMSVIGCQKMIEAVEAYRPCLQGKLSELAIPTGTQHYDLLLKEVLLKAQDRWDPPYKDCEMCHCRLVETETVKAAIVSGAHTVEKVSRLTGAGTGCGSCKSDIENYLEYLVSSRM